MSSLHINRYIDNLKAHEARGQRDFQMSMRDAKDLHADITKLLLSIEQLREQLLAAQQSADEVISVELAGGSFKNR